MIEINRKAIFLTKKAHRLYITLDHAKILVSNAEEHITIGFSETFLVEKKVAVIILVIIDLECGRKDSRIRKDLRIMECDKLCLKAAHGKSCYCTIPPIL